MITFEKPMENKAMRGHLIRSAEVDNQGSCRVMCYMEPILDLQKEEDTNAS